MSATASLPDQRRRFGVVVPVKPAAVAKSRLQPLGDAARRALVAAFAVDTVQAALECPAVGRVLVVTDDVQLALRLRELGADAVPDGESGSLNATLHQGAAELVRRTPELRPVALCADLPALRPLELARALAAADASGPAFVADAAGVGTTMYAAHSLAEFDPRFGAASRAAHLASGATELPPEGISSLRSDVDTPEDLRTAAALGLGPRTSWVVTTMGLLDR
jgi:2-phospho-L-lactate guanylyltransferase